MIDLDQRKCAKVCSRKLFRDDLLVQQCNQDSCFVKNRCQVLIYKSSTVSVRFCGLLNFDILSIFFLKYYSLKIQKLYSAVLNNREITENYENLGK